MIYVYCILYLYSIYIYNAIDLEYSSRSMWSGWWMLVAHQENPVVSWCVIWWYPLKTKNQLIWCLSKGNGLWHCGCCVQRHSRRSGGLEKTSTTSKDRGNKKKRQRDLPTKTWRERDFRDDPSQNCAAASQKIISSMIFCPTNIILWIYLCSVMSKWAKNCYFSYYINDEQNRANEQQGEGWAPTRYETYFFRELFIGFVKKNTIQMHWIDVGLQPSFPQNQHPKTGSTVDSLKQQLNILRFTLPEN